MDNTATLPEREEKKLTEKKAKEIIGLPVITFNKGTKIYDVEDIIVDPQRKQALALVVAEGSLFHSALAIPFGRISAIGPDAVIVPDAHAVVQINRDKVLKSLYNDQPVRGLKLITDDGRKLGEIADMLIDTRTGEIKGYYASMGRALTVGQGLRWLPADSVINMGTRVAYVPASAAQDFESQSGGISGALDQAGDKLRGVGATANTRLVNLGDTARIGGEGLNTRLVSWGDKAKASGEKFNEQLGTYGDQAKETLPKRATTLVVGRTAHKEVVTPDGTPIVAEGETITEQHVEQARTTGRLPQLLIAAGTGPAREGLDKVGTNTEQSLNDIRTEARDLWAQLTGNYTRTVNQTDDKFMQRRIKHALGRPVTRVILDGDDNIILNTGDIITNRAVQAAADAEVLDILVDSVYDERPKLGVEELKASHSGDASLEKVEANGMTKQAASATRAAGSSRSSNSNQVPPA